MIYRVKNKHEVNGVLIGMILGDAYMQNTSNRKASMGCVHALKQRGYLQWKRKLISPYYFSTLKPFNNNGYPAVKMHVATTKKLFYLYQDFYSSGRKIVKLNLLNRLTDIGIAIWYMDDGCLVLGKNKNGSIHRRNIYWSTHKFGWDRIGIIVDWMAIKFGVSPKVTADKGLPRIRFNTTDTRIFLKPISNIINSIGCMRYKADLKYIRGPYVIQ